MRPVPSHESTSSNSNSDADAKFCGSHVGRCFGSGQRRFTVLASGALVSACGFALFQEAAIQEEGFKFYGYMTLLTSVAFMACGQIERLLTSDTHRVGQLTQYLVLSVLTFSGMAFTNASLKYINYPTRVLFKSSKLVPTMIVGTLMQGRRYSLLEYLAALTLVAGIVLFTLGDSDTRPSFEILGVVLITVGVFADAATSNYEEKAFFRLTKPASQPEVITYSSLFGTLWAVLVIQFFPGWFFPDKTLLEGFQKSSWATTLGLAGAGVCGYLSVTFVLLLIQLYGATVTEMIKSLRKVITVVMSFIIYAKPLVWKYYLGLAFVVFSLIATQELQRRKGGDVRPALEGNKAADLEMAKGGDHRTEAAPLAGDMSDTGEPDENPIARKKAGGDAEPSP